MGMSVAPNKMNRPLRDYELLDLYPDLSPAVARAIARRAVINHKSAYIEPGEGDEEFFSLPERDGDLYTEIRQGYESYYHTRHPNFRITDLSDQPITHRDTAHDENCELIFVRSRTNN